MEKINSTFSWTNEKVDAREISENSKGVFAKENIKKGELITVFGGYIMNIAEEEKLPESIGDNAVQICDDLVLGIKNESDIEIACYFNHSCNPNVGFKGQIFLVSMKDIFKGEEITFDYGTVLFRSKYGTDYEFECKCGEDVCRKKITNDDWKIPELQKKYNGYFQYYLEEKIKNQK